MELRNTQKGQRNYRSLENVLRRRWECSIPPIQGLQSVNPMVSFNVPMDVARDGDFSRLHRHPLAKSLTGSHRTSRRLRYQPIIATHQTPFHPPQHEPCNCCQCKVSPPLPNHRLTGTVSSLPRLGHNDSAMYPTSYGGYSLCWTAPAESDPRATDPAPETLPIKHLLSSLSISRDSPLT